MMPVVRSAKIAFALACLMALQGCAAVALSVAGLVGGTGLDHTLDGIVSRTYAAPMAGTRLATEQALARMGMTIKKGEKKNQGWAIEATATGRIIEIDIEPLSNKATRAQVIVSHADVVLIKDKSTGIGILDQIAADLEQLTPERHRLATAQMLLTDLGYDPGGIDGRMGGNTRKAILKFQREHNIRRDATASPDLIAALRKRHAAREAAMIAERTKTAAQQNIEIVPQESDEP